MAYPTRLLPTRLPAMLMLFFGIPSGALAQSLSSDPKTDSIGADAIYDELARMDSIFFESLFARCDAALATPMITEDVEFYDDRTGLRSGDEVRADFRRITGNCPAANGVRRVLLDDSVDVYPINDFGALQSGVHHFVERGASTSTVARFFNLWKRTEAGWKLARIVSVDHRIVDAAEAAWARNYPNTDE